MDFNSAQLNCTPLGILKLHGKNYVPGSNMGLTGSALANAECYNIFTLPRKQNPDKLPILVASRGYHES